MKVILTEDVKGTGKAGEIVDVAKGYANNYLFRKQMAKKATEGNIKQHRHRMKAKKEARRENEQEAKALKEKIEDLTVTIKMKAGDGKLFGSVTKDQVRDELKSQHKLELDKKDFVMENIKDLGTTNVKVKLFKDISAQLEVNVEQK
ncbi:MAG: 50S ribosomal protein L9 [Bacillota bacterium]